ncbi:MAG: TIGR02452 family protein [Bacteroidales bacterium]|nr:TIGR02452 family protein [Bacteroidales bacterium]
MNEYIAIFNDTFARCKDNETLSASVTQSIKNQYVVLENETIVLEEQQLHKHHNAAKIIVSTKRTFEAAKQYADSEKKVCALNFANAFQPGGGVVYGCTAQEESICRLSTLYPSIATDRMMKDFYLPHREKCSEISNGDLIYTPDVKVFKTDTYIPQMMPQSQWFDVNVITCAAPDLRRFSITNQQLEQIHLFRAKRIIETAISNQNDVLILGAFGCGAFCNNPVIVANVYKNILPNYLQAFETVEFAIFAKSEMDVNYSTFKKVLV